MAEDLENWRKRLIYQSWYRGTKETDLILGPFAREKVPSMEEADLARYEQFLKESDTDIYYWITGEAPIPAFIDLAMVEEIRKFWK